MCGFSGKPKRIFNLSFVSDPILVQGFAHNMVQYVMAGCQSERRKNDSQISEWGKIRKYDVWIDRYVTISFLNSGTMEKAHRKHPCLNYIQWRENNYFNIAFTIPILLQHF